MAHPEIILLHLLASDEKAKRQFAVDKILRLRDGAEFGETSNRPFSPPTINWEADAEIDLIDWKKTVITEPIQTGTLSTDEIKALLHSPLILRAFTCNAQSLRGIQHQMRNASKDGLERDARDKLIHDRCDPCILMAKDPVDASSDDEDTYDWWSDSSDD